MRDSVVLYGLVLVVILVNSCTRRQPQQPEEKILARVGDRTISVEEFKSRAEYTIRPAYCRGDNYIHRKIVLNSLIAEKLLALEAGADNPLLRNEQFQLYIRGRKEQAMRQWLYYHDFYKQVRPDSQAIQTQYQLAGRTYHIAYFTVHDPQRAKLVQDLINSGEVDFKGIYRRLGGLQELPQRQIHWADPEDENIIAALFSQPLTKGQIIGPVQVDNDLFTTMQILGWTDRLTIGGTSQEQRYHDARLRAINMQAGAKFRQFNQELMKGKTMYFNPNTFPRIVQIMGDDYLLSQKEKEELLNLQLWDEEMESRRAIRNAATLDDIADEPFLRVDGMEWSVRDFQRALLSHPLVFRKNTMKKSEFAAELQKAIADLIQDYYLTQEAYRRGYDRINLVQRTEQMWRDHLLAYYQRNQILEQHQQFAKKLKDFMPVLKNTLDPYIQTLRQKYSAQIYIDTDAFEQIKLTSIDMFVTQKGVPFPVMVPSFPILTTHAWLDYGQKLLSEKKP